MFGNPMLSEEERALCQTAPEECLRRLVARGEFSLDNAVAALPPQVAEAVRAIAAGERVTAEGEFVHPETGHEGVARRLPEEPLPVAEPPAPWPEWARAFADAYPEFVRRFKALSAAPDRALTEPLSTRAVPAVPDRALQSPLPADDEPQRLPDWVRTFATAFPHLFGLLEQGRMTPHEAIETIRTIDNFLGNYPTGARYAAP